MRPHLLLIFVGYVATAAGCTVTGPASIHSGRRLYNDAIVATNNEQVLAMIVRMRYLEPTGLLAVNSVTANVRIQANTSAQFGIGPDSNFEGNLVPLSAGAVYEENPTISYTPVQGPEYLRQLLSPIPLDVTVLVLGASHHSPEVMALMVRSVNDVPNPRFHADSNPSPDNRFSRISELLAGLDRRGSLTWAREPGDKESLELVLKGRGAEHEQQVAELHSLLGLDVPRHVESRIILPVYLGVGDRQSAVIELTTPSVFELFELAAASVDVPAADLESGLAQRVRHPGPEAAGFHIRRARSRPALALVAVQHHGWWYYVDATDASSKNTFRLLSTLLTARIADSISARGTTPMLTVPVAR